MTTITGVYVCPRANCTFACDDLGLFVEHVSTISRKEFEKALIVSRDEAYTF